MEKPAVVDRGFAGVFPEGSLLGTYSLCPGCDQKMSKDTNSAETDQGAPSDSTRGPPPGFADYNPAKEMMERRQNSRLGDVPGAGPTGSQLQSYEELPDHPEALKRMYLELQRGYQDAEARAYRERSSPWRDNETSLEDYLSQGWNRIRDVVGVFAAMIFVMQLVPVDLALLAQITGAIAVSSLFDTWLRPIINRRT